MPNEPNSLASGTKLLGDRFEIIEVLGKGGFGITYRAEDKLLQSEVAVKEYFPSEWASRDRSKDSIHPSSGSQDYFQHGLDSFLREARILAMFTTDSSNNHHNIAKVYNFFKANRTAYMVMEYVRGENLATFLERHSRLDENEILKIIFPLLEGLDLVHKKGVIHRDIKPRNIILRPDGSPCLLDFGAAREVNLQQEVTIIYSPPYAPPEQLSEHDKPDSRTDIYALGAVCYQMITGKTPLPARERRKRIKEGKPDPLALASENRMGHYRLDFLKAVECALRLNKPERPKDTMVWQRMMVSTETGNHNTDSRQSRKAEFLDWLRRHFLFQSPEQRLSTPVREVIAAPTADNLATESNSASQGKEQMTSAEGSGYLSDERAEPFSLAEVGELPPEAEKATASTSDEHAERPSFSEDGTARSQTAKVVDLAHHLSAKPRPLIDAVRPAPTAEKQIPPKADEFSSPATAEPPEATPNPGSTEPWAMPEGSAPAHGVKSPIKDPVATSRHDRGMDSIKKTQGVLDKLFETGSQPSTAQSAGNAQPPGSRETPAQKKEWSKLFERRERSRPTTAGVFKAIQTDFEESRIGPPAEEPKPKAAAEVAKPAITAHNDRAWKLCRDHDYEGALAELEAARNLEPDNRMLMANIKRIQQRLRRPTEPEGDPWATS